jgi:hypothetical protein
MLRELVTIFPHEFVSSSSSILRRLLLLLLLLVVIRLWLRAYAPTCLCTNLPMRIHVHTYPSYVGPSFGPVLCSLRFHEMRNLVWIVNDDHI